MTPEHSKTIELLTHSVSQHYRYDALILIAPSPEGKKRKVPMWIVYLLMRDPQKGNRRERSSLRNDIVVWFQPCGLKDVLLRLKKEKKGT